MRTTIVIRNIEKADDLGAFMIKVYMLSHLTLFFVYMHMFSFFFFLILQSFRMQTCITGHHNYKLLSKDEQQFVYAEGRDETYNLIHKNQF
jgi:hypothetical protein